MVTFVWGIMRVFLLCEHSVNGDDENFDTYYERVCFVRSEW